MLLRQSRTLLRHRCQCGRDLMRTSRKCIGTVQCRYFAELWRARAIFRHARDWLTQLDASRRCVAVTISAYNGPLFPQKIATSFRGICTLDRYSCFCAAHCRTSLYFTMAHLFSVPPQKCSLPLGSDPHLIHGSRGHLSHHPKRQLDRLRRFCRDHQCDDWRHRHTHTQTTLLRRNRPLSQRCCLIMIMEINQSIYQSIDQSINQSINQFYWRKDKNNHWHRHKNKYKLRYNKADTIIKTTRPIYSAKIYRN